ncbi:3-hydroxyisobutyrate dehydrogenase, partial [Mesorhizobium sp. M2D.F.Ca.ET.160.01.1.1]
SRAASNRDALLREFMAASGKLSHDEIVARNRAVTA